MGIHISVKRSSL